MRKSVVSSRYTAQQLNQLSHEVTQVNDKLAEALKDLVALQRDEKLINSVRKRDKKVS